MAGNLKLLADTCHELGYLFSLHDQYRDYYVDAPSFSSECVASDLLTKGRVLTPLVITQDEARVPRLGLERLHLGNGHNGFGHDRSLPRLGDR